MRLLNKHRVEYLLIGGYAVGFHGFPRATGDMDIWVARNGENAGRIVDVLKEFGFTDTAVSSSLFTQPDQVIRMGIPPMRIELLTAISGVDFESCFLRRENGQIDGIPVNVIGLEELKRNKTASGRLKDLADLEQLP